MNGLPAAQQAAGAQVIEEVVDSGVIRGDAPLSVPALLALAAVPIAWHVPPFGQVGLALFAAAVLLSCGGARGRALSLSLPRARPAA